MYSTFFGVEMGKRALITQQLALHTTSHNIANANTPGYSRQISSMVSGQPFNVPETNRLELPGQLGTGVKLDFIGRARDMMLERQIQQETSTMQAMDTRVDYLDSVEFIINEPSESSIGEAMNRFWAGWQELSFYPEDVSVRNSLLTSAQQVVQLMQTKDTDLQNLQNQADSTFRTNVARINEIGAQLRDLNVKINQSFGVETEPNDLLDKRDALLRELSGLVDYQGTELNNGLYSITINGHTMVQDEQFVPINVINDPLNNNYATAVWSDDGSTVAFSDGELQGLVDMRDNNVPAYRAALNDLALGLMNAINPVHQAGFALNAAAPSGQDFFTGTGIADIAVNALLIATPTDLAAATNPNAPGDGSNALAIAQLKDANTMSGGTQTIGEFYQNLLAQIGLDGEDAKRSQGTQEELVDSFNKLQESESGVNLDEEMTDLIRYQDAYNAAARVVTTMDDMIDTIINRMGRVGL